MSNYPKWLINNKTQEVFKVKSVIEENFICNNNSETIYTICDHEPTQKDIDYYIYGV